MKILDYIYVAISFVALYPTFATAMKVYVVAKELHVTLIFGCLLLIALDHLIFCIKEVIILIKKKER